MISAEFADGDRIAGYEVLSCCGSGSYGEVYRVRDILGTLLALKVLNRSASTEREISALIRCRSCRHPNLITIHHIGQLDDGRYFYTMDLADNRNDDSQEYFPDTLAARLERYSRIPPETMEKITGEILAGLSCLHRAELIHRDIKPENILFIKGNAVLGDIGLIAPGSNASLIGTPDFMPPELLKSGRTMSAADDCYASGKVIYCMLSGLPPRNFPSLPRTLETASEKKLFAMAVKACSSSGFTDASAFQSALRKDLPKHLRIHPLWLLLLIPAVAAAWWFFPRRVEKPAPQSIPTTPSAIRPAANTPIVKPTVPAAKPSLPSRMDPKVRELLKKYELPPDVQAVLDQYETELHVIQGKYIALMRRLDDAHFADSIDRQSYAKQRHQYDRAEKHELEQLDKRFPDSISGAATIQYGIRNLLQRIGNDTPTEAELFDLEHRLKIRNKSFRKK